MGHTCFISSGVVVAGLILAIDTSPFWGWRPFKNSTRLYGVIYCGKGVAGNIIFIFPKIL